ncbi:MAG TPA: ABC transporter permease [Phycisphaerae bacterium]|nr:ABC transporter permease [Phycisphaerae bacterium]
MALPLSYNWKNLFVRKTTTMLTVLVIAAVVAIFAWLMSFATALASSLSFANDHRKIIVLKQASTSETNSAIPPDEYNKLSQLDREVALDPKSGQPLKSPEMIVQVSLPRIRDGGLTRANVAVRGVTDDAFKVHKNVKLLGEGFHPGQMEVVVGLAASKQFQGLLIGDTLNLGYSSNRKYKVIGYFSADGGPMESEIWGPLTMLMDSYSRRLYSSVSLRLTDDVDPKAVIDKIQGPSIELTAESEPQYWDDQAKNIKIYLYIVSALVGIMCVAAAFSIANTMFSSVAARTREFAMLRTIGFSGGQILTSIMIEAIFLSILGGLLGCAACYVWLIIGGNTKDMFGASTFTSMAFEIKLTLATILISLAAVSAVGLIGALIPALRASKTQVVQALREA